VTLAAPEQATPEWVHDGLERRWGTPPGLGRLTAVNHSIVGLRFIATGTVFFLVGGLLAMLMRAQLATSDNAFLDHYGYNQVFTLHGTIMMFLFAIPIIEGMALYLTPKLLGARDLAFPRLSAFGYWCYLFGGTIVLASIFFNVAPDSGWFMYPPLSSEPFTPGKNADVWLLGITFVEISAIAIGVELTATVLKVRTAGMGLQRMPLFGWYMLVVAVMIMVGFPPLILASVLLELERAFGWPFFAPGLGGEPLLWQHLFWLFGHPEVYIIFLPGAAIASTLIPVFARRPIVGYSWVVASVVATGFISFGLWVHHMYAVGIPHLALLFFSAASMMVAIPTGVQVFVWIATLWQGRPVVRLPLLYLFGALFVFVAGGLTGVMLALVPFDWQVHDTHFVVAHMHYVLVGGFVLPLLAGAYYWMPHVTGRMPSDTLGTFAFWLIFIGFNLTFFIMHLTGLIGMPRRVYTYPEGLGWDLPNLVSSIGGFIMSAGFALAFIDLFVHARLGRPAGSDPWGAHTLEWAMPIPPPSYNMASLPEVAGREPLRDDPELAARLATGQHLLGRPRDDWRETLGVGMVSGRPDQIILLPGPSWLPLCAGLAMALFVLSFLFEIYVLAGLGALIAYGVFLAWGWNNGAKEDAGPIDAGGGLRLLPHYAVAGGPGWWGLVFALVANATFYLCIVYGYLYLWTVAPAWPPPAVIEGGWLVATIAALGMAVAWYAARRARLVNADGRLAARSLALIVAALGGATATLAFAAMILLHLPSPSAHAYGATTTVLAGYSLLHLFVTATLAVFALLRCRAGYVSAQRNLDLRILELWSAYSGVTGIITLAALLTFPTGGLGP
jgi:cytochrome c oxidase subunit I+III